MELETIVVDKPVLTDVTNNIQDGEKIVNFAINKNTLCLIIRDIKYLASIRLNIPHSLTLSHFVFNLKIKLPTITSQAIYE